MRTMTSVLAALILLALGGPALAGETCSASGEMRVALTVRW